MKIFYDFHIHSCLSPCGDLDMTPNNIVNMAQLLGLTAIAVSDHNSAKNLPAISNLCTENGLLLLPAIEACTSEEVHMLCYFEELEECMAFSQELYTFLPPIQNKPDIFGEQLIMDEKDQVTGFEDKLLINALNLNISDLIRLSCQYHGHVVPAHVNKKAYSLIANLGFIPPEYGLTCIEVNPPDPSIEFEGRRITDSDAHYLEHIHEASEWIEISEKSAASVLSYLRGE